MVTDDGGRGRSSGGFRSVGRHGLGSCAASREAASRPRCVICVAEALRSSFANWRLEMQTGVFLPSGQEIYSLLGVESGFQAITEPVALIGHSRRRRRRRRPWPVP